MTTFRRAVGPRADVNELEYVAALQQTCAKETRACGTISSIDIMRYLKSRHSLEISHAQARDIVLGLGGGVLSPEVMQSTAPQIFKAAEKNEEKNNNNQTMMEWHEYWKNAGGRKEEKEEEDDYMTGGLMGELVKPKILYLDLVQMTSILLIPTLTRLAKEWKRQNTNHPSEIFRPNSVQQARLTEKRKKDSIYFASMEVALSEDSLGAARGTIGIEENLSLDDDSKGNHFSKSFDQQSDGLLVLVLHSIWKHTRAAHHGGEVPVTTEESPQAEAGHCDGNPPPLVNTEMVKGLLMKNGEFERANDSQLVQRMVDAAKSPSGRLDELAFVNALTSDLGAWNVGCEDRMSTYVYDVFGTNDLKTFQRIGATSNGGDEPTNENNMTTDRAVVDESRESNNEPIESTTNMGENPDKGTCNLPEDHPDLQKVLSANNTMDSQSDEHTSSRNQGTEPGVAKEETSSVENDSDSHSVEDTVTLHKRRSFRIIDSVVDSYGSFATLLLAWLTYLCYSVSYTSIILTSENFNYECDDITFNCTLLQTIISWLIIALIMSSLGILVLIPLSFGNHPTKRSPLRFLYATIITLFISIVLHVGVQLSLGRFDEKNLKTSLVLTSEGSYDAMVYLGTALGFALAVNYFIHFLVAVGQNMGYVDEDGVLGAVTHTSDVIGSSRLKQAASRKIDVMLNNARQMHGPVGTKGERDSTGLTNSPLESQSNPVFQNYTIFVEGHEDTASLLWTWNQIYSGRLFDTEGIWLPSRLWIFQLGQVGLAGFIFVALFKFIKRAVKEADKSKEALPSGLPQWVYDIVPTGRDVKIALIPAAGVAVLICTSLIFLYIPSTVATVLKYRSGYFASLGSPGFHLLRNSADTAYMNTANAVYGMLAAATLFFFVVGLILFLFIWEFSRDLMVLLSAWGIGLTITIVAKVVLTSFCRKRFFRAFYRVHPGTANISSLALECWYLGIGGGILVGRLTQFLLASAFWIGRIDEPFLADNVRLAGYKFDYVSLNYVKEILVHEAHRHPYIERLGTMYLMRLRHKSFGSDAGGCWRQLFVLTLMPWLMKHRVFHEKRCSDSVKDRFLEAKLKLEEEEDVVTKVATDVMETGAGVVEAVDAGAKLLNNAVANELIEKGAGAVEAVDYGARIVAKTGMEVATAGIDAIEYGAKAVTNAGVGAVEEGVGFVGKTGTTVFSAIYSA